MKRILTVFLAVSLLLSFAACQKTPAPQRELFGTVLADGEFCAAKEKMEAGAFTGMQLYVANGADFVITDREVIDALWQLLGQVRAGEAVSEPGIDDGLIVFLFLFDDGSSYSVSFLTSEYVYGDDSAYTVNNPEVVRRAYKLAMAQL